ncbi:MAG: hypothetical protein ACFFFH_11770 [Candidatus Thorarchaeota archaeon]
MDQRVKTANGALSYDRFQRGDLQLQEDNFDNNKLQTLSIGILALFPIVQPQKSCKVIPRVQVIVHLPLVNSGDQ